FTLKGVPGRYIGGSGKRTCSMPLLANFGGVKEVHVLWMEEPQVSPASPSPSCSARKLLTTEATLPVNSKSSGIAKRDQRRCG
ncbi:hypothetical protein TSMEX_007478, partial [Taenia solium]